MTKGYFPESEPDCSDSLHFTGKGSPQIVFYFTATLKWCLQQGSSSGEYLTWPLFNLSYCFVLWMQAAWLLITLLGTPLALGPHQFTQTKRFKIVYNPP